MPTHIRLHTVRDGEFQTPGRLRRGTGPLSQRVNPPKRPGLISVTSHLRSFLVLLIWSRRLAPRPCYGGRPRRRRGPRAGDPAPTFRCMGREDGAPDGRVRDGARRVDARPLVRPQAGHGDNGADGAPARTSDAAPRPGWHAGPRRHGGRRRGAQGVVDANGLRPSPAHAVAVRVDGVVHARGPAFGAARGGPVPGPARTRHPLDAPMSTRRPRAREPCERLRPPRISLFWSDSGVSSADQEDAVNGGPKLWRHKD